MLMIFNLLSPWLFSGEFRFHLHAPESNLQQAAALLLLELKESYKLTQSTLQGVIEGTTKLWQQQL